MSGHLATIFKHLVVHKHQEKEVVISMNVLTILALLLN